MLWKVVQFVLLAEPFVENHTAAVWLVNEECGYFIWLFALA
jgi:hypothetical protein